MSPHQGSLFCFRGNYMGYYEKQLAQLVRATDFGLEVTGSSPVLFLFVFIFRKGEDHNG